MNEDEMKRYITFMFSDGDIFMCLREGTVHVYKESLLDHDDGDFYIYDGDYISDGVELADRWRITNTPDIDQWRKIDKLNKRKDVIKKIIK